MAIHHGIHRQCLEELPLNPDIVVVSKSLTKAPTADFPEVPSLGV